MQPYLLYLSTYSSTLCSQWAERLLEGGGHEQWGDKWSETFGGGAGQKNGETWSAGANGERYNRWWGEDHYGDGTVRRHGNSTGGENWDQIEHMDTYYNPVPHFGFDLALSHSNELHKVPVQPKLAAGGGDSTDGLGSGLDDL